MIFFGKRAFPPFLRNLVIVVPAVIGSTAFANESLREETRETARIAASILPPQIAKSSLSALSGEYVFGNGFNINCQLEILSNGRFEFSRWNCDQLVEKTSGTVTLKDNKIILHSEIRMEGPPFPGTGPVLIPVPWDQRLYLIPEHDLLGFCNTINRGVEPITHGSKGSYFLREGDWEREAKGKPELPEEWKPYVLDVIPPGTVIGRDPSGRWIINLGAPHRMFQGLELTAYSPSGRKFITLRVTEVGQYSSAVDPIPYGVKADIQNWVLTNPLRKLPEPPRVEDDFLPEESASLRGNESEDVSILFLPESVN